DPLGEDACPVLLQGPVGELDRLEAAGTQFAAHRPTQVDLHGNPLGAGFRLGRQSPTINITMPSTGSNGRTIPPRNAASQRGRKRRMGGLSALAGGFACLVGGHRLAGLVFDVQAALVVVVELVGARITLAAAGRSF